MYYCEWIGNYPFFIVTIYFIDSGGVGQLATI